MFIIGGVQKEKAISGNSTIEKRNKLKDLKETFKRK